MLGASRALIAVRVAPITTLQVRHKGTPRPKTVPIMTITHRVPFTDKTMGPYPRTPEERLKAARKYNLIPEDYEPYEEEEGWGDYPKLPIIGSYNRDKYDDFDDIHDCRFYGEPLHKEFDMYTWERIDPLESKKMPPLVPYWKRFIIMCLAGASTPFLYWFFQATNFNINQPHKIIGFNLGRPQYGFPDSPNDHPGHHHHHH